MTLPTEIPGTPEAIVFPAGTAARELVARSGGAGAPFVDARPEEWDAPVLIDSALSALAAAALAEWPSWFETGEGTGPSPLESVFSFDACTSDIFRVIHRAARVPAADQGWLKAAVTMGVFRGSPPFFPDAPAEIQARQLSLVLGDRYALIRVIPPPDPEPPSGMLTSFAKGCEWLAGETGMRVAALIPETLRARPELAPVMYRPRELPGPGRRLLPAPPPEGWEEAPAEEGAGTPQPAPHGPGRGGRAAPGEPRRPGDPGRGGSAGPGKPGGPGEPTRMPAREAGSSCRKNPGTEGSGERPPAPERAVRDVGASPGGHGILGDAMPPSRSSADRAYEADPVAVPAAEEPDRAEGVPARPAPGGMPASSGHPYGGPIRPFWDIEGRPNPLSPGESVLAESMSQFPDLDGLFAFNVPIVTSGGGRFIVDLLWEDGRLVVEIDGYSHHSSRQAFAADRERDFQLMVSGYRVMRIPHVEAFWSAQDAVEKIRKAVEYVLANRR
ncbi:MAG: DUF559 domain-containing protein [Deltaproteobacteria bacterium]|jgi:hypothetical protein|nr:DUF559 domain-containing protein [Deltaproteobacteria bacterium]